MTDRSDHETIDELLDAYVAAWHRGDAPDSAAFAHRAAPSDRDELAELIAAFLELAPTVAPTPERAAELAVDPLAVRLGSLEDAWWDARAGATDVAPTTSDVDAASWGASLRMLRERAGLSIGALASAFAARFGLSDGELDRVPVTLAALERGTLPATGVAARAARALEHLLDAPRGALVAGVAPALADPRLRGALPEEGTQRERFTDLLRHVDDALSAEADGPPAGETLRGLLGEVDGE